MLPSITVARRSSALPQSSMKKVADVPLPGAAVRFDYQSLDLGEHRLYIAHMNGDQVVVFDTKTRTVVANLDGFRRVHDDNYMGGTSLHWRTAPLRRTVNYLITAG